MFSSWINSDWDSESILPLIYVAASAVAKLYVSSQDGRRLVPSRAEYVGKVTQLTVYPIKSMGGIAVNEAECTSTGFKMADVDLFDRRFLLTVGDDHRFVTARQCPKLLLIKPSVNNGRLYFDAPNMEQLSVPLDVSSQNGDEQNIKQTKVWGQPIVGVDCGPEAADWFSRYLARPSDGQQPAEEYHLLSSFGANFIQIKRKLQLYVNALKASDQIVYHDDGPFLLTTEASLGDLNQRIPGQSVSMEYFRPSITVNGSSLPFDEDNWNEVFIGGAKFTRYMPCARCLLTTIDPVAGEIRKDGEPLKTLSSYRVVHPGCSSPCFGIYLVSDRQATIHVNDSVFILRRYPFY